MPKIYLVEETIRLIMKKHPLNNDELEKTKNELFYKTTRELENLIEKLEEEDKK